MPEHQRDLRLARLDALDLARTMGTVLLGLERLREENQPARYEAALALWEDALKPSKELTDRVLALGGGAAGREAIRKFAKGNRYRAAALQRFGESVLQDSPFDRSRWQWAAHAYGRAIRRFVQRAEEQLAIPGRVQHFKTDFSSARLRGHAVLQNMGELHLDKAESPDVAPAVRLHALTRVEDLLDEIGRRDRAYEVLKQRCAELRQQVCAAGVLPRATELVENGTVGLRATAAAYEVALREAAEVDRRIQRAPVLARLHRELAPTRKRHAQLGADVWMSTVARFGAAAAQNLRSQPEE